MSATGILLKRGPSKSEKIVQAFLYVVLTGVIVFYGRDYITELVMPYANDLPLSADNIVTLVSVMLGLIVSTALIYFFKRSVRKEEKRLG